jgi:hypothetical protein
MSGWFGVMARERAKTPARDRKLLPGTAVEQPVRVPLAIANRMLASTVRLVADLPLGASGNVVWSHRDAELLVRTEGVRLALAHGIVSLSIPVACDQLRKEASVVVPLAVGSEERPAGLVMTALARPAGPEAVTAIWSDALTAFAWESLLHLAQQVCGAAGRDAAGRPLVPASIAATPKVLIVRPMARNELSSRSSQVKA